MMTETYVVFSDLHGRRDRANTLFRRHPDADAFLFLGDGLGDLPLCEKPLSAVRGNCDGMDLIHRTREEMLLDLGEYRVLMMHGHRYFVKSGLDRALSYAAERGANVLLYGHTHQPSEQYFPEGYTLSDGRRLPYAIRAMNPGSLGAPPDGSPSYGLLQIRGGQILLSHGVLS